MAPSVLPQETPLKNKASSSPTEVNQFTWQDLSTHNKDGDLFIAIRGKVYDVSEFAKRHPGGMDMLRFAAGRDATLLFEMYHPLEFSSLLPKFYIGELITNQLPTFPEPSPFHRTVRNRVHDYFIKNGKNMKSHTGAWIRYTWIFVGLFWSYYMQFFASFLVNSHWGYSIPFAMILGFCCAQIGLNTLHDGTHGAITKSPLVWRILGCTHDFFNGTSHVMWVYQHVLGHHPFTNISGVDPDVSTDIRRVEPHQQWYRRYLGQEFFMPVVYGVLALQYRITDITTLYVTKNMGENQIRINPLPLFHHLIFWGGKSFWVFYRVILPIMMGMDWTRVIALLVIQDLVSSYWLAFTFQVNHVVEDVDWPIPNSKGQVEMDWGEMQVTTTVDYAHKSIWTVIAGALNYQAEHHLFPGVNQHYYTEIAPIVMETCKEFNVRYRYETTFFDAFLKHILHLRNMGLDPSTTKK